jgi:hypothetical protein
MSWPENPRELFDWFREEMDSEGRPTRHWGALHPDTQIAWGKLYRRLQRENPQPGWDEGTKGQ